MSADESLLTPKSLALSLAAPRMPPHGTAHRALLIGGDPTILPWTFHHDQDRRNCRPTTTGKPHRKRTQESEENVPTEKYDNNLHRQWVSFLQASTTGMKQRPRMPHPHLPSGPELAEYITRTLGVWLPLSFQNYVRDAGHVRTMIDRLMHFSAPAYALIHPEAYREFQRLSHLCVRIPYATDVEGVDHHPSQVIDMFLPPTTTTPRGLIFFVHGGAWGSGNPWLYRLIASPFLQQNLAVAVVGYRTYPCGSVLDQVQDLRLASQELVERYPRICQQETDMGVCIMGHSSGAHIGFLMVAEYTRQRMMQLEEVLQKQAKTKITSSMAAGLDLDTGMRIDSFVGISGPYNISHHFDYEASQGLEEISPMKAACGFSREEFRKLSPALRIVDCMSVWSQECEKRALDNILPQIVLLHGIEDDVVPFTSTAEAASLLRSCGVMKLREIYFAKTAHNECVTQIMMGGIVRDALMDCLQNSSKSTTSKMADLVIQSRL